MVDISIPVEPKKAIYQITTDFPVNKPYSNPNEWQKILARYSLD